MGKSKKASQSWSKAGGYGVAEEYLITDELWSAMRQRLPPPKLKLKAGRPGMDDRKAMTAVLYIQGTSIQKKALPSSSVGRRGPTTT